MFETISFHQLGHSSARNKESVFWGDFISYVGKKNRKGTNENGRVNPSCDIPDVVGYKYV